MEPVNSINAFKKQKDKEKQDLVHAIELTKEIINTKSKDLKLSSDKVIKDKIVKKLTVKLADKGDTAVHDRPLLVSAPELRTHGNTGLYYSNSNENIIEKPLGQLASEEDIKHSIQSLQKLIQNYESYVIGYDHAYGTRIIEAILYAFTSPFIWEVKNKPELSEGTRTIPQFMILGGTANSGKSKLLTIIKKMMGLYGRQNWYLYSKIIGSFAHKKVSNAIEFLNTSMTEENMTPLMVDELDEEFFSSAKRGEGLIVDVANYFDSNRNPMPTFIGTTNSSNYSMNERGKSRTYYIRIDKVFDNKFEKQSTEAYVNLLSELDDKLFQDFIVRFSKKLNDDSIDWAIYPESSNTGSVDFLYYAREIFKEYFEIAGIRVPEWFPLSRYDDKKETDQELWRKQYEYHTDKFKLTSDGSVYLFNLKELDEYEISARYGDQRKPSDFYRQSMPQDHLLTTGGTDIIEIKVDSFHKWIGVAKPKKSLIERLFKKR